MAAVDVLHFTGDAEADTCVSSTLLTVMSTIDTNSILGSLLDHHREQVLEIAKRHRARRVFGSVARGEANESSDIDLLVDFEEGSSLFDLLHLTEDLQELLGRPVDVVSSGGLKDRDNEILAEAIDL